MRRSRMGNVAFFASLMVVGAVFILLSREHRLRNGLILASNRRKDAQHKFSTALGERCAAGMARCQRKTGLCPVQRLDLTLLVDAEHQSLVWRIQV